MIKVDRNVLSMSGSVRIGLLSPLIILLWLGITWAISLA